MKRPYYEPGVQLNDLCINCVDRPKTSADGFCDECFDRDQRLDRYNNPPYFSIMLATFALTVFFWTCLFPAG